MHRALLIPEILLNIIGHCAPPPTKYSFEKKHNADLPALARVCRAFKEPALDVLWEELSDLTPIARCLHEACRAVPGRWCYTFSRSLTEAEWNTLRGYTRRVWHIYKSSHLFGCLDSAAIRVVFTLAPFTDPLFSNLRSIDWDDVTTYPVAHAAVPSLVSLHLNLGNARDLPAITEFLDAIGERCPNMKRFQITHFHDVSFEAAIARQLCRWTNLQRVDCHRVTLGIETVLHLCSLATLIQLSCTLSSELGDHASHSGSPLVPSKLSTLQIESRHLESVTNLFSLIRCPAIKDLIVEITQYASKRDVRTYWTTVQNACTSNTLTQLSLDSFSSGFVDLDEGWHQWLMLDDLLPYKDFGNLHKIYVNVAWSANLTDADILDLVSTSPQLKELSINKSWGWRMNGVDGGITPNGLVQLLRQRPSLYVISLVINTPMFTQIPPELDVSFPPRRELFIDFLDSYISPDIVSDLAEAFIDLDIGPYSIDCSVRGGRSREDAEVAEALWRRVQDEMAELF